MKRFFKIFFLSLGVLIVAYVALFVSVRKLDNKVFAANDFPCDIVNGLPTKLPSHFINGERFFLLMPVNEHDTIKAAGDTGGGLCFMMPDAIERYGLVPLKHNGLVSAAMPVNYILVSDLVKSPVYPKPILSSNIVIRTPFSMLREPYFFVPEKDEELKMLQKSVDLDAFLGQNFFVGKSWTFDYPKLEIWLNTPLAGTDPGIQKLGFKKDQHGRKMYGHPSMKIEIDGEQIDVLFDTGASISLDEEGKKTFHTTNNSIGGSFIVAAIFDKWRTKHPDWKYYPKADFGKDVIEVPAVTIGGNTVGPVLFAKRPPEVWSRMMINTMDKVVSGAIGGSAFKYLKVTIDYNSELAKFEKPI
jgi:hypothetical protein